MNHIILCFNTMIVAFGFVESKDLVRKVLFFTHRSEMTVDLDAKGGGGEITLERQHQKNYVTASKEA